MHSDQDLVHNPVSFFLLSFFFVNSRLAKFSQRRRFLCKMTPTPVTVPISKHTEPMQIFSSRDSAQLFFNNIEIGPFSI